MTAKQPDTNDVVTEVENLLNDVGFRGDFETVSRPLLRRLVEEVKRLRKRIKTMERDALEDARDAAAEARWQERQGEDYGSY